MALERFDHVNVRTGRLDEMVDWYGRYLGLMPGRRPDFGFPGAWLYLGDQALIHFVGISQHPQPGSDLRLEHFAFSATGMKAFLAKLDAGGIAYSIDAVPGFDVVQVNFFDPDGNHIHVDFNTAEQDG